MSNKTWTKWDYLFVYSQDAEVDLAVISGGVRVMTELRGRSMFEASDRIGEEGWELVSFVTTDPGRLLLVFKRPRI